ncbi:unnamed protein product [Lasius platythorax]|uniref:Uncharacterized protein n=1 Tax=Lasius platythorax TaxID=488582 RepID=A0AAV2NS28_9HYME
MSRQRIINFARLDSKINQPRILSARDRDTVVDEAQEHRDDIESYDEARDCLPDLSDIAPTVCLPETGKLGSASTNLRDMEQREFVYRIIVDSRRHKAIHGAFRLTRQSLPLPRAYIYITVCTSYETNKESTHHRMVPRVTP